MALLTPLYDPNNARDLYAATEADKRRAQAYKRAADAYDGMFHGGDPQWPLLWKTGKEPNPNIIINRCGPAVDTDVSWLMGDDVSITLGEKADKAAQEYVDAVWGVSTDDSSDDDKMSLLQELATNGAIYGTAYLKIVWDEDDEDQEYPELCVLDSSMVRVQTEPHNAKVVRCYIIEYAVPDPTSKDGTPGMFRQVIEVQDADNDHDTEGDNDADAYWTITDYFRTARQGVFLQVGKPRIWPYTWAPIEACAHIQKPNSFYGRPRITPDVIHVNEAICTIASDINKIGIRHGHPILYTIKTGSNQRALRHEPGTIMEVSSDVKAVEAHGDLQHLMEFEEDLRADFDEETHVPAQAFGRQQDVAKLPQSGIAIKLGYLTLIADIKKERRTYGAMIRRVTKHLLEMKDKSWADYPVTLGWQEPLPTDDAAISQLVSTAKQAGMSDHFLCNLLDVDYEQEMEYRREEQKEAMRAAMQGQGAMPGMPPMVAKQIGAGASGQPAQTMQTTGQPSAPAPQKAPPVNSPAAVRQRQVMQAANGKKPTANGM